MVAAAVVVGRGVRGLPAGGHLGASERRIVELRRVVHDQLAAQRLHAVDVGDPRPMRSRIRAVRGLQLPVANDVLPVTRDRAVARDVAYQRGGVLELRLRERILRRKAGVLDPNCEVVALHAVPPALMTFFFNDTAPPEVYPLSLHDALPI